MLYFHYRNLLVEAVSDFLKQSSVQLSLIHVISVTLTNLWFILISKVIHWEQKDNIKCKIIIFYKIELNFIFYFL